MRPGTPMARVTPKDVRAYPASVSLYDPDAFRTLFIEFESKDWEQELAAFYHTAFTGRASVSVIRIATTTPEKNVSAATSQIAPVKPTASAATPATMAPTT